MLNTWPRPGPTAGVGADARLGPRPDSGRAERCLGLIARFPDRIRHVHLHDNHGGSGVAADLHLPIGHGCVDFAGILGLLRKAGCDDGFSFEIPLSQVERGRQAIARLWDEARQ